MLCKAPEHSTIQTSITEVTREMIEDHLSESTRHGLPHEVLRKVRQIVTKQFLMRTIATTLTIARKLFFFLRTDENSYKVAVLNCKRPFMPEINEKSFLRLGFMKVKGSRSQFRVRDSNFPSSLTRLSKQPPKNLFWKLTKAANKKKRVCWSLNNY